MLDRRGDSDDEALLRLLQAAGYENRPAWIRIRNGSADDDDGNLRGKNARAKAKQRAQDRKNGWAEVYAKAPDDEDARRLIAEIGKAIKDERMRKAIRLTLRDPRAAFLGARILNRRGVRWRLARLILAGRP